MVLEWSHQELHCCRATGKLKGRKEPRILPSGLRCPFSSSLGWLSASEAKMKRSTVVTLTSWVPSPKIEHPISCDIPSFDTYPEINTQGPRAGNTLNPPIPASQEMPIVQLLFIHHFISWKLCAQPNEWYHVHKKYVLESGHFPIPIPIPKKIPTPSY